MSNQLKLSVPDPTQEARDGMAQSGMESGMTEGYERLDELLGGER